MKVNHKASNGIDGTWDRLLDAALTLFADRGFAATGIREIARVAEVSSATLYHYVKTKEELLEALMHDGLDKLLINAKQILASDIPPIEQLELIMRSHVMIHGTDNLSTMVVDNELRSLSDESRVEIMALRDSYEDAWATILQRGIDGKCFADQDPHMTRLALLQMGTGVAYWYNNAGRLGLEEIAEYFGGLAVTIAENGSTGTDICMDLIT